MKNLKNLFLKYSHSAKLEINHNQIKVIEELVKFYKESFKKLIFRNLFSQDIRKKGFYLIGDVGVGKTMLLDFFYKNLKIKKKRFHFNEFMINFHNFVHVKKKKDSIKSFVKKIKKKYQLLYFDEFQVTNIVDAMILGKLFECIFREDIKVIFTSNVKIESLYKDGLQRDQFIPFIKIMKNMCIEHELIIKQDYRKSKLNLLSRFFYPLNEVSNFKINQMFRRLTKHKKLKIKKINIKGREFIIKKYFDKIARFDFSELCDRNIWSEDYIKIANYCKLIVIENIPNFNDKNINKQLRFVTLIDILYEKKIFLIISASTNLNNFGSAQSLQQPFKRTLSRLHELTSLKIEFI